MKTPKLAFLVLVFALICSYSPAQSKYVTIGAFRVLGNAVRFANEAKKNGLNAQYAFNSERKLYYVYLAGNEDMKTTWNYLMKIRNESVYKDAWIYLGSLESEQAVAKTEPKPQQKVELKPSPKEEAIIPKEEPKPEKKIESVKEEVIAVTQPPKDSAKVVSPKIDSSSIKEVAKEATKPKGKPFYFKVVSKADGKELKGNIQLQEAVGATQYKLIKSGEVVYIEAPVNKSGAYGIITQLPGYKETAVTFDYANPSDEKGSQNENIITLEIDKAKKGDYVDFNNVRFFKNTSIMQPSSQGEIDALVAVMKENPKYKIKIFGFVNKKQSRETLTMGTSTQFFALDNKTNKRANISAKELSQARAETVKAYLVQQGIEAGRISTKGEGGSVPLYPEDGNSGERNDRVEVEFVKH